jgi:hypothetical protein
MTLEEYWFGDLHTHALDFPGVLKGTSAIGISGRVYKETSMPAILKEIGSNLRILRIERYEDRYRIGKQKELDAVGLLQLVKENKCDLIELQLDYVPFSFANVADYVTENFQGLRKVTLRDNRAEMTSDQMEQILKTCTHAQSICLEGVLFGLTDVGLRYRHEDKHLRLKGPLTPSLVETAFRRFCPSMKRLTLKNLWHLDHTELAVMVGMCRGLQHVSCTPAGIGQPLVDMWLHELRKALASLPHLKSVQLYGFHTIPQEKVREIFDACKELVYFDVHSRGESAEIYMDADIITVEGGVWGSLFYSFIRRYGHQATGINLKDTELLNNLDLSMMARECPKLKEVYIRSDRCGFTKKGLQASLSLLPGMHTLILEYMFDFCNDDVIQLANHCTHLRCFALLQTPSITIKEMTSRSGSKLAISDDVAIDWVEIDQGNYSIERRIVRNCHHSKEYEMHVGDMKIHTRNSYLS